MKIVDIDFEKMFRYLESNVSMYGGASKRYIISGKDIVKLEGYIYEPGYEFFSVTHSIELNGETLFGKDSKNVGAYQNEEYTFGKFNSDKEAIEYLKQYFGNKEIIIKYDEQTEVEDAEMLFGKNAENIKPNNVDIEEIQSFLQKFKKIHNKSLEDQEEEVE